MGCFEDLIEFREELDRLRREQDRKGSVKRDDSRAQESASPA